jgi:hypothetical protein
MPKYSRISTSSTRTTSVAPTSNTGSTATKTTTTSSSNSDAAERRRERYVERQARLRALRQDANFEQQQELNRTISEQAQVLQQYASDEPTEGNDSSLLRLNQMVETAEQLIVNLQRRRRLERDTYDESRLLFQETLELLGQTRQYYINALKSKGSSNRTTRMLIRNTEKHRRNMEKHRRWAQHRMERLEKAHQEEDKNLETIQAQVRRVIGYYRERERSNAVRSAFLERSVSLSDCSKDYRISSGRILKATCAVSTEPNHAFDCSSSEYPNDLCNDEPDVGLSAHFGDNDMTLIHHGKCVICLYEYQVDDVVVRNAIRESHTRCNHLFHEKCVTAWIESSRKAECPCCRQPFVVKT